MDISGASGARFDRYTYRSSDNNLNELWGSIRCKTQLSVCQESGSVLKWTQIASTSPASGRDCRLQSRRGRVRGSTDPSLAPMVVSNFTSKQFASTSGWSRHGDSGCYARRNNPSPGNGMPIQAVMADITTPPSATGVGLLRGATGASDQTRKRIKMIFVAYELLSWVWPGHVKGLLSLSPQPTPRIFKNCIRSGFLGLFFVNIGSSTNRC